MLRGSRKEGDLWSNNEFLILAMEVKGHDCLECGCSWWSHLLNAIRGWVIVACPVKEVGEQVGTFQESVE